MGRQEEGMEAKGDGSGLGGARHNSTRGAGWARHVRPAAAPGPPHAGAGAGAGKRPFGRGTPLSMAFAKGHMPGTLLGPRGCAKNTQALWRAARGGDGHGPSWRAGGEWDGMGEIEGQRRLDRCLPSTDSLRSRDICVLPQPRARVALRGCSWRAGEGTRPPAHAVPQDGQAWRSGAGREMEREWRAQRSGLSP